MAVMAEKIATRQIGLCISVSKLFPDLLLEFLSSGVVRRLASIGLHSVGAINSFSSARRDGFAFLERPGIGGFIHPRPSASSIPWLQRFHDRPPS